MERFEGFSAETIDFLWELRMNNSREWMERNRDRYKSVLKEPFDRLAAELAQAGRAFGGTELAYSVSRINRDIRFSKDKSPYRACRWVVLHSSKTAGTGWKLRPAFYFELNPESYTYGMGLYHATPVYLTTFRRKLKENPAAFLRIAKKNRKGRKICTGRGGLPENQGRNARPIAARLVSEKGACGFGNGAAGRCTFFEGAALVFGRGMETLEGAVSIFG